MLRARASFIPTIMVPYLRVGYWSWMKLPDPPATSWTELMFSPFVHEYSGQMAGGVFWIDEEEKKRVLEAKKKGEKLPAVTRVDKTYKR